MNDNSNEFSSRRFLIAGMIIVAVLVGGVGRWFVSAELSGAIISNGSLKVKSNSQIIQHLYGGVVDDVYVVEGSQVSEGDVLIRFDGADLMAEMQIVSSQLAEVLARAARLRAERDGADKIVFSQELLDLKKGRADVEDLIAGQERLFESRAVNLKARKAQVRAQIAQISNRIEGLSAQRDANIQQSALLDQELKNQESLLEKQLTQAGVVSSLLREVARMKGVTGQLQADMAQAKIQISDLELEILNFDALLREEAITALRDMQIRSLELRERYVQIVQRTEQLEIRAPLSGTVYDLSVFASKAVVRAADPLMYLVPQGQVLTIEAKVLPTDIEQIHIGQSVDMKFSSFSQRTTPDLFGTVSTISADTFLDDRTGANFYLLEVAIQDGEIAKLPEGSILIPGMPVDIFIETKSQTPLEYMAQPFRKYIDRAFRES